MEHRGNRSVGVVLYATHEPPIKKNLKRRLTLLFRGVQGLGTAGIAAALSVRAGGNDNFPGFPLSRGSNKKRRKLFKFNEIKVNRGLFLGCVSTNAR